MRQEINPIHESNDQTREVLRRFFTQDEIAFESIRINKGRNNCFVITLDQPYQDNIDLQTPLMIATIYNFIQNAGDLLNVNPEVMDIIRAELFTRCNIYPPIPLQDEEETMEEIEERNEDLKDVGDNEVMIAIGSYGFKNPDILAYFGVHVLRPNEKPKRFVINFIRAIDEEDEDFDDSSDDGPVYMLRPPFSVN